MQEITNLELTSALKMSLKSRGITYKWVADQIDVSEQTIKRLFREKDCSLSRLNQICQAVDISLYDLMKFAKHHVEPHTELTPEQVSFLGTHPSHFAFLFFLTTNHTLLEIQSTYKLSDTTTFRYLRDLDRNGFLELSEDNKFRLLTEGKLLMRLHGPVHDIVKSLNQLFFDHTIENDGAKGTEFSSSFRYLAPETLDSLNSELSDLNKKYRDIGHKSEKFLPKNRLIPVKWTTMASPFAICGKWGLDREL